MLSKNVFIDTAVLLDTILPLNRKRYRCSSLLIDSISKGDFTTALTVDYVLSELLGRLKGDKELKKGTSNVKRETLTPQEKHQLQSLVDNVKNIPHLKIFKPSNPILQQDIYNIVSKVCVQTKDAPVLLSALNARNKIKDLVLVTRDERLLNRSKSQMRSAHPSEFIDKCPSDCLSIALCPHRRRGT